MRRVLPLICVLLIGLQASQNAGAQEQPAAQVWLGLIAGSAAASETVLAAEMASLFTQSADLRVRPLLGDAGTGNLALLLDDPDIDLAFVATEAVAAALSKDKSLPEKFNLVAKLSPQEVHLLARSGIGDISELSGKTVNFGPEGSASAVIAASLFKTLGINVEAVHLDGAAGIEQLKRGGLSAAVIVGGRPSPLIAAIPINAGVHLLPVPFNAPLDAAYLPAQLNSADYPNLIRAGSELATIATGIVLLAKKAKDDPASQQRIDRFVAALFPRFAELQAPERHPKWREVNLAASLPGFERTPAAEAWLAATSEEKAKLSAASATAGRGPAFEDVMNKEQQEVLFKRFIEWQRGKSR